MALNKEIWIGQIKEGFYPNDNFLTKVTDYSEFVDNHKLHIASAGIDPNVLINNTTYPIDVVGRTDDDNVITLDKFETENTIVRHPEAIEYSYDKLESVIRQHRSTLRKGTAMKAIHAFAPEADSGNTPLVLTTGEASGGRLTMSFADILTLKERFDDAGIPFEDRYVVLHPKHATDLMRQDLKLFKNLTDIQNGEPFRFAGFGFFVFPQMPVYRIIDGTLKKAAYSVAKLPTDQFASVAFYSKEVMKADGEVHMYSIEDEPRERATIVGFDKRFVALPIRGIGVGAIVSENA